MLAKLSSKNQITIPKKILAKLPPVKYFEISYENGAIILRPVQVEPIKLDAIRQKMKKLGLSEDSVAEAVKWAREK
ncbi:AbrB/MazE/SpoVT family DNA-binding domain-containing protein [Thermosulfurimonas dismutans]|nr:AbrB/MazE/SpoVT family DNA-binding domain-containing protein [Thermosulfurimonas dismutans]